MKKNILLLILIFVSANTNAQTSKSFKWIPWKSVNATHKAELKKIAYLKGATAYDKIIEDLEYPCDVSVAVLDMDGDGKMEYAVRSEGGACCGSLGCTLNVYSDGGKKQILLTDYLEDIKPAKNGVISSKGVLIRFQKR
jgi:hypothetical protein